MDDPGGRIKVTAIVLTATLLILLVYTLMIAIAA
ncbi:hypothetical protein E143388_07624 [Rhodococcus opacus]|nr:hypothetical protein E143388_07624 [Rhodococcus opacus]